MIGQAGKKCFHLRSRELFSGVKHVAGTARPSPSLPVDDLGASDGGLPLVNLRIRRLKQTVPHHVHGWRLMQHRAEVRRTSLGKWTGFSGVSGSTY